MKYLIAVTTALALATTPALAQGKGAGGGQGNGHGNGQGNGLGHGNGPPAHANAGGTGHGRGQNSADAPGNANGNRGRARTDANGQQAGSLFATAPLRDRLDCPPGLAFRDPPCVPPGQAAKGVTFEDWTGASRDELDDLLDERDAILEDVAPYEGDAFLTEDEIRAHYGLDPAEPGYRYAVIDGQLVRLSEENYARLQQIRTLAALEHGYDVGVPLDDHLDQAAFADIYGLPALPEDQHYAVVDGQVIVLPSESYDLLQLIRLAAALTG